jgi:hypothetical protein
MEPHRTPLRTLIAVLLGIAVASPSGTDAAGTYRWTAADGTVTYSDKPQPALPEAAAPEPAPARAPRATPAAPAAREAAPSLGATADEVLEMSGVKSQLALTPNKIAGGFKPRGSLNAEDAATLEQILARNFDADRLYGQIRAEFKRRVDGKKLPEVALWMRSPLGQKIIALEMAAAGETDAAQRMSAFAPGGRGGPPPARVALMERIDWTAGVTDGALESTLAVARAMAMAINRALPPDERQTTAQVELQIQQLRGQSRAKLAQATITYMLYQYRSLDDDELQQYGDFLASDAGHWYTATMSKAMNRTVAAAAQRAAGEVIRAIPPPRWSGGAAASPRH